MIAALFLAAQVLPAQTVWLDDLNLGAATQGWGEPHKNQSVDGHPLTIGGQTFERGFGTHAESILSINLNGGAQKFSASVGVDDEVNRNPRTRAWNSASSATARCLAERRDARRRPGQGLRRWIWPA